jgi:hypothetical protein
VGLGRQKPALKMWKIRLKRPDALRIGLFRLFWA